MARVTTRAPLSNEKTSSSGEVWQSLFTLFDLSQEAITGVDAFLESSDLRNLPCAPSDSLTHIDAAHETSTLISGTDSLDLSLSMMPEGQLAVTLAVDWSTCRLIDSRTSPYVELFAKNVTKNLDQIVALNVIFFKTGSSWIDKSVSCPVHQLTCEFICLRNIQFAKYQFHLNEFHHGLYGSTSCCISHGPCQWERAIFDPPQLQDPWTDFHETWNI